MAGFCGRRRRNRLDVLTTGLRAVIADGLEGLVWLVMVGGVILFNPRRFCHPTGPTRSITDGLEGCLWNAANGEKDAAESTLLTRRFGRTRMLVTLISFQPTRFFCHPTSPTHGITGGMENLSDTLPTV